MCINSWSWPAKYGVISGLKSSAKLAPRRQCSSAAIDMERLLSRLVVNGKDYNFYDLEKLTHGYDKLPYSIRVLLESAVRSCDDFRVTADHVNLITKWETTQHKGVEVPYLPARVLLQDFTGVPAVVDLAAMRDAMNSLGGDPQIINPLCPVDLVIDHSVQVDHFGNRGALQQNQDKEFERNKERFLFLKWGQRAFSNMSIVPPGSGIVHQVNLESIARVVFQSKVSGQAAPLLYCDSVVGTDSHTTMIAGLGVLGWGVGGIEAEAVMLGQPISMVLPQVVGYKLLGRLPPLATATDLVLTITKHLRSVGVVGKFVEFFGPGCAQMSVADRATVANMCPEYGATVGFFPTDANTLEYLRLTGRDPEKIEVAAKFLEANGMLMDYEKSEHVHPNYSMVLELDLASVCPCVSGPKRPHDRVPVANLAEDFSTGLTAKVSFKGFGVSPEAATERVPLEMDGVKCELRHGSVVIAAITSCTNTSNPSVMLAAGLVAKKAVERGLKVPPFVKTSLSPGSGVVTKYLDASGLLPYLEKLGFHIVGYGCMTCIGNSGPLPDAVASAIDANELVVAGVLSGNRNFEGRIHAQVRANYLASPPLVVAYALAGNVQMDFDKEPIGVDNNGAAVYFRDIWPTHSEVAQFVQQYVTPKFFKETYDAIQKGNPQWQSLECPQSELYPWDDESTYIKKPPFFENMGATPTPSGAIKDARALLLLGDSVTTDHISPAGGISRTSPAARWLGAKGLSLVDFNTYGARRGHDEVMARGTFANVRLVNKLASKPGPTTLHVPSGQEMDVHSCAMQYKKSGTPVIIVAGKEYGSGSSRDWAAKGPHLLGVRAVIAESFERIHRSNLVGMGIVPLQFVNGQSADSLQLNGTEKFSIELSDQLKPAQNVEVKLDDGRSFEALCRFDTEVELTYWRHGGILQYVVRKLAGLV